MMITENPERYHKNIPREKIYQNRQYNVHIALLRKAYACVFLCVCVGGGGLNSRKPLYQTVCVFVCTVTSGYGPVSSDLANFGFYRKLYLNLVT